MWAAMFIELGILVALIVLVVWAIRKKPSDTSKNSESTKREPKDKQE